MTRVGAVPEGRGGDELEASLLPMGTDPQVQEDVVRGEKAEGRGGRRAELHGPPRDKIPQGRGMRRAGRA